jgi:hypothetical protein
MDKDLDDLQRKKKRSPHVVYTEHYDVQNYIFLHGNLVKGAASAASVDPVKLSAEMQDPAKWCLNRAKLSRGWIALCLQVMKDYISCEANYSVISPVQTRPSGPTDNKKYGAKIRELAMRHRISIKTFKNK